MTEEKKSENTLNELLDILKNLLTEMKQLPDMKFFITIQTGPNANFTKWMSDVKTKDELNKDFNYEKKINFSKDNIVKAHERMITKVKKKKFYKISGIVLGVATLIGVAAETLALLLK